MASAGETGGSFRRQKLLKEAKKNWDLFYKRNTTNFFKDRHWVDREFEELRSGSGEPLTVLELGCGVGNFAFPLLERNVGAFVYACDFSEKAIDLVKSNSLYSPSRISAFTVDLSQPHTSLSPPLPPASVDFASMLFVLSALPPDTMHHCILKLKSVLKCGAVVGFRDYGRGDGAEVRFGAGNKLSLEDGATFYARQDGTFSYFFTVEDLRTLFVRGAKLDGSAVEGCEEDGGFEEISCEYVRRETTNAKEAKVMERVFVQAKFRRK
ncbi:S-adenosyl-L-methionine-dependent methyltransferase [Gonapodya prolifera JEL478]|uniref:tRNA N(3)-methylcytidine methyltransferase n=1 Tax=Gonapodya prolifera (strain JEL478) TaxID=1344416 RepID=A0A139AVY6_GONPJ|nr:S-adenosyl-L-methionine-dependent methyltransferase [Gonapodya prolifera JEL478]|eukprot:KXS20896.1 S-adenosyl-L-methionine-dependent methyltransferase [Gonapodya prolifera JEL478]